MGCYTTHDQEFRDWGYIDHQNHGQDLGKLVNLPEKGEGHPLATRGIHPRQEFLEWRTMPHSCHVLSMGQKIANALVDACGQKSYAYYWLYPYKLVRFFFLNGNSMVDV